MMRLLPFHVIISRESNGYDPVVYKTRLAWINIYAINQIESFSDDSVCVITMNNSEHIRVKGNGEEISAYINAAVNRDLDKDSYNTQF